MKIMTKLILLTSILLSNSFAFAGFECNETNGLVKVTTIHDENSFYIQGTPSKVTIFTSEKDEIQMSALFVTHPTRVNNYYTYKLPIEGVSLSIHELTLPVYNSGCSPGGRITCDHDWKVTYKGNLKLNGMSYDLDCQNK